jgi:hypothetical protein
MMIGDQARTSRQLQETYTTSASMEAPCEGPDDLPASLAFETPFRRSGRRYSSSTAVFSPSYARDRAYLDIQARRADEPGTRGSRTAATRWRRRDRRAGSARVSKSTRRGERGRNTNHLTHPLSIRGGTTLFRLGSIAEGWSGLRCCRRLRKRIFGRSRRRRNGCRKWEEGCDLGAKVRRCSKADEEAGSPAEYERTPEVDCLPRVGSIRGEKPSHCPGLL